MKAVQYFIEYMEKSDALPSVLAYSFKEVLLGKAVGRGMARQQFRAWKRRNPNVCNPRLIEFQTIGE